MTINDNIRRYRIDKQLSQGKLGELLGVSGQAVSKWEQGITSPDISLLPILAECFGVTIDSLFAGSGVRKYPGYQSERNELLAMYTRPEGTKRDYQDAMEAFNEVILSVRQPQRIMFLMESCIKFEQKEKMILHYITIAVRLQKEIMTEIYIG